MADRELFDKYATDFLGYGNLNADVWLIGKEEGSQGEKNEQVNKHIFEEHLKYWNGIGRPLVMDMVSYHQEFLKKNKRNYEEKFSDYAKSQKTWRGLIRILWVMQNSKDTNGKVPSIVEILEIQKKQFGRKDTNLLLIELMPIPAPSTSYWCYTDYYPSRHDYFRKVSEPRIDLIRKKIFDPICTKPRLVIFYGEQKQYIKKWVKIIEPAIFKIIELSGQILRYADMKDTFFICIPHPAKRGIENDYFHSVGRFVSKCVDINPFRIHLNFPGD